MSGYTKAEKNAKLIGDVFDNGDLLAGSGTWTTSSTTEVVAHGLTGTPDFVVVARADGGDAPSWTADGTNVTFVRAGSTNNIETFSYVIGDLT